MFAAVGTSTCYRTGVCHSLQLGADDVALRDLRSVCVCASPAWGGTRAPEVAGTRRGSPAHHMCVRTPLDADILVTMTSPSSLLQCSIT